MAHLFMLEITCMAHLFMVEILGCFPCNF